MDAEKKNMGFFRRQKKDEDLKDFIKDRDIVFLVDRSPSMGLCWDWAKYLVETLAMKLARLDDDGLDLIFTTGHDYNVRGAKKPALFKAAMEKAWPNPELPPTDMTLALGDIFRSFLEKVGGTSTKYKKMTLIIVTDGTWAVSGNSSREHPVIKKIVDFINELTSKAGKSQVEDRWFSIQFISFAQTQDAHRYLKALDSKLHGSHKVPDIIDTKPWDHCEVKNMILGSFSLHADEFDEDDDED